EPKIRKRLLKSIVSLICKCVNTLLAHSRLAIRKTDHKQNYYRSFLYKDKLGLHLIWKKTLSEDFQEVQTTFRKFRRLPDDFQEVQTTFRKFRRLSGIRTLYNKKLPNEEKSDIKTYQNAQIYYERETSSEDFHEVQIVHYSLDD
ncbi:hypothetical protein IGI04_037603, partial [Brassica rapa subsp. trilocularis]